MLSLIFSLNVAEIGSGHVTGVSPWIIGPHKSQHLMFSYSPEDAGSIEIFCDDIQIVCGRMYLGKTNCTVPPLGLGLHICQTKLDIVYTRILVVNWFIVAILIGLIFGFLYLFTYVLMVISIPIREKQFESHSKKQHTDKDDLFEDISVPPTRNRALLGGLQTLF